MKTGPAETKATVSAIQEEMKAAVRASKDEMKVVINSICSELEEAIKNWMEKILASGDQQAQGLCEELNEKIKETQLHLKFVMMSVNTCTRSLKDDIMDTKKNLHKAIVNTRKDLHKVLDHTT